MRPTDLHLFSEKEQTLLVATEPARLAEMSEDELDDLLTLVRRARNKYSKLYRRQGAASVAQSGKRSATATSNERTLRKAEVFEDALARVARSLSAAARRSRDELKAERLAAAKRSKPSAPTDRPAAGSGPAPTTRRKQPVSKRRASSTRAAGARSQARRDARPRR